MRSRWSPQATAPGLVSIGLALAAVFGFVAPAATAPMTARVAGGAFMTPVNLRDDLAYSAALQADGKIVAVGVSEGYYTATEFVLARYGGDGKSRCDFRGGRDGRYALRGQYDGAALESPSTRAGHGS